MTPMRWICVLGDLAAALRELGAEEDGQDVVEYGLLVASIAVVVLIGVTAFGSVIGPWFNHLAGTITTTGL
ncbi:MAG: Flp family type IVb pilin [Chloroflexi bacterium]|nr:MAG: Flp family type IVb pilin [Chloroflexota bacterium]